MGNFNTDTSFAIILLAALIHASFQLSVSVLTLMSGHALGNKTAHDRLLRLTGGFLLGAGVMTLLLVAFISFVFSQLFASGTPLVLWAASCGAVVGVGVAVWLFYYRDGRGTGLWLPRGLARYLDVRSKATKQAGEAFGLGLTSVITELLFILAPMIIASLVLIRLPANQQLFGILLYTTVSLLPLLIVSVLIGGGHRLSGIQRWRETNKNFLQFTAGSGLLILGIYVFIERVIVSSVAALGVQ